MKGMTGFARASFETANLKGTIQVKAYNNRYLDISVFLPSWLGAIEPSIRALVEGVVAHGKVDVSLRIRECQLPVGVSVDEKAAVACAKAMARISELAGLPIAPTVSDIIGFEGVLSLERELDAENAWQELESVVAGCLAEFDRTRIAEGDSTREDIGRRLASIRESVEAIRGRAGTLEKAFESQLRSKLAELAPSVVDENRILAEVAVFATRSTISEELARLESHVNAFMLAMDRDEPCGKKLDFICQEMNREANTIGSKNVMIEIGQAVIALKSAIEDIREQVRNIE